MTKRTRAEFELIALPLDLEIGTSITTSEVGSEIFEGGLTIVGSPASQSLAKVAVAEVEFEGGQVDEVAPATEALEEGLETHPFWALLIRAGHEFV